MDLEITPAEAKEAHLRLVNSLRSHALLRGSFRLKSGAPASYYIDVRRAVLLPQPFRDIGLLIAQTATELGASAVGGVPLGGIPPACAALAARAAGRRTTVERAFFLRPERKGHGLGQTVEGPLLREGERCLLVEDVVTTGSSTVQAVAPLRAQGVALAGVVCVLDRLAGGGEAIEVATGAPFRALTTIDEIFPDRPDR